MKKEKKKGFSEGHCMYDGAEKTIYCFGSCQVWFAPWSDQGSTLLGRKWGICKTN